MGILIGLTRQGTCEFAASLPQSRPFLAMAGAADDAGEDGARGVVAGEAHLSSVLALSLPP